MQSVSTKSKISQEKEEMCNTEQITHEALKAMIEKVIKEFNKKIEKEVKRLHELRISRDYIKKELEMKEYLLKRSNT